MPVTEERSPRRKSTQEITLTQEHEGFVEGVVITMVKGPTSMDPNAIEE